MEAKGSEQIWPKPLDIWLLDRHDNTFWVSPAEVSLKRIESQYRKGYDYGAVFLGMTTYRATGLWLGPTSDKAQDRWFCFELSAWFREIDGYWCKIPDLETGSFKYIR